MSTYKVKATFVKPIDPDDYSKGFEELEVDFLLGVKYLSPQPPTMALAVRSTPAHQHYKALGYYLSTVTYHKPRSAFNANFTF